MAYKNPESPFTNVEAVREGDLPAVFDGFTRLECLSVLGA